LVYLYRCPICGSILYNSSLFVQNPNPIYLPTSSYIPESKNLIQQDEQNLIPPSELIQLKGKQIQTTIPLLGTITACVGDYDATTNRVKLSNITKVSNGEKIGGTMGYLPEELVGYEIINETCPGSTSRSIFILNESTTTEDQKTIHKTIKGKEGKERLPGVPFSLIG